MLVSVLINNYNYGAYLGEAVASVLAQTHENLELIIVDDGSTDDSPQIIESLSNGHPRIVACCKSNGGQLSAFNAGYALARGDVLFFLDADDLYHPDYVAKAVEVYRTQQDCDFLFCAYERFGAVHEPVVKGFPDRLTDLGYTGLVTYFRRTWIGEPTSTLSLRRSLADQFFPIPFEPEWRIRADDCLVWLASLFNGRKFYLKEPSLAYRVHDHNHFFGRVRNPDAEYRRTLSCARLLAWAAEVNGQYRYLNGADLEKLLLEEAATGQKNPALLGQYRRALKQLARESRLRRWRAGRKLDQRIKNAKGP